WRILAITFTNKAADELKSRLAAKLGEELAGDIWAQTFHSACVRILRRNIDRLGYANSFTIYDSSDSLAVMKRVLKDLDMDEKTLPPRLVLSVISRAKDQLQDWETFAAEAGGSRDPREKAIAKAYAEYQRRLKSADAVDFDDLIFLTVKLLTENEEVRAYYQRYFKYVLVDEYQDTSLLQYRLVSLLSGGSQNLCVVGDDDQSIYRFRGATIENILSFEQQFPGARLIKLEQNYRSTGHILEAANAVIRHNRGRKGKELWTQAGAGERPLLVVKESDDEEAQYVASAILEAVERGASFKDFAVLYRMNAQSNRLEYAFKRQGIPYKVVGGMRFFDRAEIKDITSYLALVRNPQDDLRLLRVVNTPARGIGAATLESAQSLAHIEGLPLFEVIRNAGRYPSLRRAAPKLAAFAALILTLAEKAERMPLDEFYDALLEETGYVKALGNSDEALARVDNLNELKSNILTYMEGASAPSLAGFLDEIALYTDLDGVKAGDSAVILMTMHAA
ncbi:MAG: ATP-dependent helicase, partial [bacterium]